MVENPYEPSHIAVHRRTDERAKEPAPLWIVVFGVGAVVLLFAIAIIGSLLIAFASL